MTDRAVISLGGRKHSIPDQLPVPDIVRIRRDVQTLRNVRQAGIKKRRSREFLYIKRSRTVPEPLLIHSILRHVRSGMA
jgi:hypothetical protein